MTTQEFENVKNNGEKIKKSTTKQDVYFVKKSYGFDDGMKGGFYLRFTENPKLDVEHKYSRWYDSSLTDEEAKQQGYVKDESGEYYIPHTGLSGHYLKAENLEDAIKESEDKEWWFKNINHDSWAIFEANEDDYSVIQDTPEGNTFYPEKVLFERKISN